MLRKFGNPRSPLVKPLYLRKCQEGRNKKTTRNSSTGSEERASSSEVEKSLYLRRISTPVEASRSNFKFNGRERQLH